MKIVIEIDLGNEAMQTAADVLGAIQASGLNDFDTQYMPLVVAERGGVRDLNGNTVGHWEVVGA